jgi:hypothetical protein
VQVDASATYQDETRYGLADLNRFDISANQGNVVGTRRSRLLVTGTYELPVGRGRQWLNSFGVMGKIIEGGTSTRSHKWNCGKSGGGAIDWLHSPTRYGL